MKNKVLIKIYVSYLDEVFEIFIPTNDSVNKIIQLVVKSISEINDAFQTGKEYYLIDPVSSIIYNNSSIVRDTNLMNGKKVVLI